MDPRMAAMGRGRPMLNTDRMPGAGDELMYQGRPVGGGFGGGMPPELQSKIGMEPPQMPPGIGGMQSKPWAEPPQQMPPQGGGGIQAFKPMEPSQMPPMMGGGMGQVQTDMPAELKQAISSGMPAGGIKTMLEGGGGPMGGGMSVPTLAGPAGGGLTPASGFPGGPKPGGDLWAGPDYKPAEGAGPIEAKQQPMLAWPMMGRLPRQAYAEQLKPAFGPGRGGPVPGGGRGMRRMPPRQPVEDTTKQGLLGKKTARMGTGYDTGSPVRAQAF